MKTLYIASILAVSTVLTLACGDDDDSTPNGAAGAGGSAQAGSGGGDDAGGSGEVGGAGGAPAAACEYGDYGAGGAAEAGGAGGQASGGIEIAGTWEELFDDEPVGTVEITATHWNDSGIAAYDGEANLVYTQTPCDDAFNPGAFTKIVYTEPTADSFYYCMVVYDAKTLADAQARETVADPDDLETGCGASGFPWSKVVR